MLLQRLKIINNPGSFHLHHQTAPGLTESSGWEQNDYRIVRTHIHSGHCTSWGRLVWLRSEEILSRILQLTFHSLLARVAYSENIP